MTARTCGLITTTALECDLFDGSTDLGAERAALAPSKPNQDNCQEVQICLHAVMVSCGAVLDQIVNGVSRLAAIGLGKHAR